MSKVRTTLSPYASFAFGNSTGPFYADIRHQLELAGMIIGPHDLMIAAIARENGLILVSNDAGFRQITDLVVEDWTIV